MSETLATVSDLEAEPQEQAVLAERIGAHATLGALTESADEATLITSAEPTGATASEDWTSISSLADSLNTDHGSVYRRVSKLEESYPQWVKTESHAKGLVKVLHPELAALVTQEIEKHKGLPIAPEGVMTIYGIAQLTGVDFITVRRVMARLEEPPQTKLFRSPGNGRAREYYLPEDIDKIKALLEAHVPAPDGAETVLTIARRLNVSFTRTKAVVDSMKEKHPELFGHHKNTRNKAVQYCYPEAVRLLEERLGGYDPVPVDEGWVSWPSLQKQSGHTITTLQKIAAPIFESHPELLKKFKNSVGRTAEYCHPEAVKLIYEEFSKYEPAPAEWYTNQGLASELGVSFKVVQRVINGFQDEYAEEVKNFRGPKGQVFTHYGPTFVSAIKARIEFERDQNEITLDKLRETEELDKGLRGFSQEVNDNESAIAQEFRSLVSLFGSERVRDILYRYHPEYQNLPVPYVKSVIADYLGDFLSAPPKLDLESLEVGVQFLFDTTLKEGLTEVVKLDCLSFYNSLKKIGDLGDADLEAILEHISDLRAETAHYSTEELSDVFNEVEDYYRSLFVNIHKPDSLVDELSPGRSFPDLNQRINMHEIATKKKMLIADEMGVGKSASAIIAKEALGVRCALVVVPSNVTDVWRDYLSDKVVDDEQIGYFKPGQAPRVLVVEGLKALKDINSDDYDYIILSQERLNKRYVKALEGVNYGMLIVDEVHKMKNLAAGKRAENLLKLAEQVSNENSAKYLALLSGTPIPNKIGDMAMVLKLLYPERFDKASSKELTAQILNGDVLDLRALLVPRMQMKSLAESINMPELEEVTHRVELSPDEREMYEVLLEEDELTASQKLQFLRKFNLNPALLDATPDINGSKIQAVGESLRQTFANKDKVVMFVNGYIEGVIRGEGAIVDALGLPEDVEVLAIEGEVVKEARGAIQRQLQSSSKKMLVLVSGQTADVGVDFSGAQEVYFYNEPWTEYDKKQQIGRVYRPGLSDNLVVRTFINAGTIEEGIHSYIKSKYKAVEKVLRGIPISELERELLKKSENQNDPNLEVNPELAEYYFSSWDRMMKIYGYVKELGEDDFVKFLGKYGREYADCYVDVGGRSYQANASRLSGTLIDRFARERRKPPQAVRVLDIASGPEMLRRHISDEFADRVVSIDINRHHFETKGQNRTVGSFLSLPISDDSVDYANLSLALHYTNFVPTKGQYERIEVLQEMNRVLSVGGRVVISLMHTLDLKNEPAFREAVTKLGFKVVEKYSGKTEYGAHFRTRLFTLEKTHNGPRDIKEAVKLLGPGLMKGFKFTKNKAKLRDSRKIATSFSIHGQLGLKTKFNEGDKITLEEERVTEHQMAKLQSRYGSIKEIPRDKILAGGFSRIFNGKSHVLFRRLVAGSGSVVLR